MTGGKITKLSSLNQKRLAKRCRKRGLRRYFKIRLKKVLQGRIDGNEIETKIPRYSHIEGWAD